MSKCRTHPAILAVLLLLGWAGAADATRPPAREWRDGVEARNPLIFRASAGTTWVTVGQPCSPADTANSGHSTAQVWCFKGAGGDSSWPSVGTQGSGKWNHWSKFAPPLPQLSKWFVSTRHVGVSGGTFSAWCGCDSLGSNASCTQEVSFWLFKEGYGDDWNYPLELDMAGQNATTGGTIEFDIRYDSECNYDYTYLEYFSSSASAWQPVTGTNGSAVFNAISGNLDSGHGGTGRPCGADYFFHSDQKDLGGGNAAYYGNALWLTNVSFPMPAQTGGMRIRWRCFSDGAWSDADGLGDTDGMAAIDNVTVTFAATGSVVSDTFESGDFSGVTATIGVASWEPGALEGNPYDGWHLEFDPKYKNTGNTCEFASDWMWSAKPAATAIPANGFDYFLVSPRVACNGWTGGVLEYSGYRCVPADRTDYTNTQLRFYNTATASWSIWNDYDGFIRFGGCDFWGFNDTELLTPYLGAEVDSLQFAWEILDISQPGDFSWGFHGAVTYLVDNVSVGQFDGSSTVFTTRVIDVLSDTFSRSDPAHTPFLQNPEEGDWAGNTGSRAFADADSLSISIDDVDGITAGNIDLFWRVGSGTPPTFGSWTSKDMVYSDVDPTSPTDEGTYRGTFGNTSSEDYSLNEPGSVPGNPGLDPIWNAGQTVEYYVKVTDNLANTAVFPGTADDTPTAIYFRFQVLPFNRIATGSTNILLVDDYQLTELDFENSDGFNPTGGAGFGAFASPVFTQAEDMTERALITLYGGSEDIVAGVYGSPKWDIYNVHGARSSVQREPRIISETSLAIGGISGDLGAPNYDAVIWLQGSLDAYTYADTTRIELKTFLSNGGKLFSTGDDIAYFLGTAGQNADSTVQFLGPYFGISFTSINDDETLDKVLNVEGVGATSLSGLKMGLYGDCQGLRRNFDKLTLSAANPSQYVNTILATYQFSDAASNGRAAIIKNVRTVGGGITVHCGFGIECLVSTNTRACLLSKVLATDFSLPAPYPGCFNSGTDAPVVAASRFGFDLSQAMPNPFRDATSIRFSVPTRTHVSIEVYNVLGQKVRQLVDETLEGNSYVRDWDGRADTGAAVSSGIYFYKMVAGDYTATRKAVVLK